jgi:SAM-dependent methyltransferase
LSSAEARLWNSRAQTRLERAELIERVWSAVTATVLELAGLKPGDRVLDVGTGHGEPALTAARIVGVQGRVLGVDVSPEMIAVAKRRAEASELPVAFDVQDAQRLELPPESFEVALCRLALMFMEDVSAALGGIRRALVPAGRLVVATIGSPEKSPQWNLTIETIVREFGVPAPDLPGPSEPGVFALADPDQLASLFAEAGFVNVRVEARDEVWEFESPEEVAVWHTINPTVMTLLDGQPEARCAAVWRAVADAALAHADADGRVRFPNELVYAAGERPGESA